MKKIKYIICLFVMVASFLQPAMQVHANGAIGSTESFNHLSGDAKYLGDDYWKNYYLDIEETEKLDLQGMGYSLLNNIANVLFTFCKWIAYLTVTIFYLCFDLNLSDLFGTQMNAIQQDLNDSIFSPLFLFGCFAAFCVLTGRILKQDLAGALGQITKIILIVMLSILVVKKSDVVLSVCNNIIKEASIEILTGTNSENGMQGNIDDFSARSAGVLWKNLIHEPWMTLQFNNDSSITENDVQAFLTLEAGSDARKALVKQYDLSCFRNENAVERIGFMIFYIIPFFLKCGVYILVAVVQLIFQLLAILYTFLAPLVLIITMVPGYETMLTSWLRKILESQISILIISLIIGILIKFDELIFDWAIANQYGWMIALVLQTAMAIGLFINRNKILTILSDAQRGVSNPRYLKNKMRLAGNIYQAVPKEKKVKNTVGKVGAGKTEATIKGAKEDKIGNIPVKSIANPFLIARRIKAKREANNSEDEAVENSVKSDTQGMQQDVVDTMKETEEANKQEERPASVVSSQNGGDEDRSNSGIRNDSLKELADEISRNITHLAEVIESAEDSFRTDQEKSQNDEARRPTLMGDKKDQDGKTSKENKAITITMKGSDGREESQKVSASGKMDMQSYINQSESTGVERPRTDRRDHSGNLDVARSVKENLSNNEEREAPEKNESIVSEKNVDAKDPSSTVEMKGAKTQVTKKAADSEKTQTDTQESKNSIHAKQASPISAVISERDFANDRVDREVVENSVNIVKEETTPIKDKKIQEGKISNVMEKKSARSQAEKKASADEQKPKKTVQAKQSVSTVVKERNTVSDKSNAARVERSVKEK